MCEHSDMDTVEDSSVYVSFIQRPQSAERSHSYSLLLSLLAAMCIEKPCLRYREAQELFGHGDVVQVGGQDKDMGLCFHRQAFKVNFS